MPDARILIVDDEASMRELLERLLTKEGYDVLPAADGEEALELAIDTRPDIVLTDLKMPRMGGMELLQGLAEEGIDAAVIIMTAYGTLRGAVEAMKLGAEAYIHKPFEIDEILLTVERVLANRRLSEENVLLQKQIQEKYRFEDIIAKSKSMQQICKTVGIVAQSRGTVLIQGETGTGKELIARAIHYQGQSVDAPFVTIDCGALPETLLGSELFGHVKGAFTGATSDKTGLFETADGGTVFLDEVGHSAPAIQARLLRVLQEGEIKRVGDTDVRKVNVRVVAASRLNLEELTGSGEMREDLFFRLNVIRIDVPPLRERKEDIPLLAEHFIELYAAREKKAVSGLSQGALGLLMDYHWPGNVRELENAIERAVILETGRVIGPSGLPENIRAEAGLAAEMLSDRDDQKRYENARKSALEAFDRRFLADALERAQGNVTKAAEAIGLDRRNLHRKLQKYGIDARSYRGK